MRAIWITALDGLDHAVHEQEIAGYTRGLYRTDCGRLVLPQSMTAPPGQRCRSCTGDHDEATGHWRASRPKHSAERQTVGADASRALIAEFTADLYPAGTWQTHRCASQTPRNRLGSARTWHNA